MSEVAWRRPANSLTGGNPTGCPDFRPLNPWGRLLPPPRPDRPALYQVHVTDRQTRQVVPIGPKWSKESADQLQIAIAGQIALGAEQRWAAPHLVRVKEGV